MYCLVFLKKNEKPSNFTLYFVNFGSLYPGWDSLCNIFCF